MTSDLEVVWDAVIYIHAIFIYDLQRLGSLIHTFQFLLISGYLKCDRVSHENVYKMRLVEN